MNQVDLSQLAVQRESGNESAKHFNRRNVFSRYVLPLSLVVGFLALITWASWDLFFPPRDVRVVPVFATQAEIRTEGSSLFNAAGWIEPRPTSIRVAALAGGVVEELLVVEDQKVKAGQPVALLVREDAQLAFQRCIADRELAEAELERARATLVAANTRLDQPVHLEAALATAEAELARIKTLLKNLPFETSRAKSRLKFAQRDFDRNTSAGARAVSEREIDESQTEVETAQATLRELIDRESSLLLEKAAIEGRRKALSVQLELLADEIEARDRAKAQIDIGKAGVKQMQVAEATAKLRLERMTIRAPVAGRIYQLLGLPGARVGQGVMTAMDGHDGATVVTMYQPNSLQIRVDVRFEDIPKVSLGQTVKISNAALASPVTGSVLFISSEADIQKNTLQVKVAIDSEFEFFKPEMLVDVKFLAPEQEQSAELAVEQELRLFIPSRLVATFEGENVVWVADQSSGLAKRRTVVLAQSKGELVEVTEGLDIGSRIISSNTESLRENQRIRVVGEEQNF